MARLGEGVFLYVSGALGCTVPSLLLLSDLTSEPASGNFLRPEFYIPSMG